jgi:hypothetical protein
LRHGWFHDDVADPFVVVASVNIPHAHRGIIRAGGQLQIGKAGTE